MNPHDFNQDTALQAARVLAAVLSRRQHRKVIMGQTVLVPGQLGEALRLPGIIHALQSRSGTRRNEAVERFTAIWLSLSERSREQVRERLGWYDPRQMEWDDPRSNRLPDVPES
ncbi:MAG: hypothetical protein EA349_05890 [Halomonadaceae bacterium]|nr:MAG: hypothetical protein EA349_05890 [Halomonadaceae bacterium]